MQIAAKAKISRALHQSRNLYSRPPTVDRPSVEAARELKTVARVFFIIIPIRMILYSFFRWKSSRHNNLQIYLWKFNKVNKSPFFTTIPWIPYKNLKLLLKSKEYAPLEELCHLEIKMPKQMPLKCLWYLIYFSRYEWNLKWSVLRSTSGFSAKGYVFKIKELCHLES